MPPARQGFLARSFRAAWSAPGTRRPAAPRHRPAQARQASPPPARAPRTGPSRDHRPRSWRVRSRRSRPDRGRKPSNDHRGPATPDAATAASTADAPGSGTTVPPSAAQARHELATGIADRGRTGVGHERQVGAARAGGRAALRAAPARCGRGSSSSAWRSRSDRAGGACAACPPPRSTARSGGFPGPGASRRPRLPIGVATTYRTPRGAPSASAGGGRGARSASASGVTPVSSRVGVAGRDSRRRPCAGRAWRSVGPGA